MLDIDTRTSMEQILSAGLGDAIQVYESSSIGGGCINYAAHLDTSAGHFFVKLNDAGKYPDMFEKEAAGLSLLNTHSSIKIPRVHAHGSLGDRTFLILEYVVPAARKRDFWENFGQGLAYLHQNSHDYFGLDRDNYIGSLRQSNRQKKDWPTFFVEERLEPQIRLARDGGLIGNSHVTNFAAFFRRAGGLFPQEPPALLHGDLWNGNFIVAESGQACLVDPAVYYGHREAELAFTHLFGGFDSDFYSAYEATWPLEKGFRERIDLYNLYPLMVHVNLFGRGYLGGVEATLRRFS